MVMRPIMHYGAECLLLKEKYKIKLSVAEVRMLKWMSGFIVRDKIRNEYVHGKVGVAPVADKNRESRLRWFGHIKCRPFGELIRRVDVSDPDYVKKSKGRAKKIWLDINIICLLD
ncbi:hypothetical protein KFK09_001240 [Dendrobium nobile]|uniref:Ataxia telangiectasia mutated family protein n=1 Tax=Dendrobium nobile TaxID=94219 RepID=A0A8T3C6X0_DENNO|nr:hypothetical protein KFK09_001240 [Dendrobium nobile]